ncbi:MAG: hypothetical protein K2Y08_06285 [Alphaproteobacteria bacterium]|nr:hypothetical protein [Alphaproteobacteria bacterium]
MSKRKNSTKKKILFPVLLGLVTLSSTAMSTIDPRLYNGTTKHYRKGKERNSPVLGAAGLVTGLVENIRWFGPFTPAYKEDGTRDYAGDTSDNPSWNIVKILFPSTGGDLASEANFEMSFGNHVDKVQTIVPLLSLVNDLREGKDVNVEALKNALFSTLKQRPPYDSQKEQAELEKVKKEVQDIQAATKADFIKALRGLGIDPNLKKEMIGYATNKYKPKKDLDPNQLKKELQGLLIGIADQWISTTIQKKQRQEDERFKKRFFQENLTPLIESIQNAVKSEKDSIFPAYTTEQLIETFFSHKFNTRENIDNLIEATSDDIVDPAVPFVSEPASAEEILEHDVLDMDDLLALSVLGMAGAPVPYQLGLPLISNGEKAWFYDRAKDQFNKDIKFSDCVDEMPRHMANMLLYDRKTKEFNMTPLLEQQKKFAEGSSQFKRLQNAIEFFEKYQSPIMANNGAPETRSWWNRVIADLNFDGIGPKVDYVKHKNELDTGHINMLRMFQNLFSLDLDPFPALEVVNEADPEKEKEALIQILQKKRLNVDPFPVLEAKAEATPEQEQEAQAKLDKDILNWKTKSRENIQKKFEEDRINWILSSFRKVFSFMNPDFVYDFKPKGLSWSLTRNDMMGYITVFVKKSKTPSTPLYSFRMSQEDGHGVVFDVAYPKSETALEIETKAAAIEPLTAEESLWLLFPQVAKTKVTEPLYQMMPRLLADNDSKINFISLLKTMDWQSTTHLATQEIAGFLSNILPTLGWDDPDTLRRITSSIRDVILDKDENLNEAVPAEIREAFFKQTKSLEFGAPIRPNFMRVLLEFNSDVLETQNSKMNFLQGLNGLDWKEISEENTSKMTGLLSNVLDTLGWDIRDNLQRITSSIREVILDKDENLNETVPAEIREVFFKKTQSLDFQEAIKPNFARVLPYFQNDMLKSQDSKIEFIASLSGIDWAEVPEHNASKVTGLLSRTLDSLSLDTQDSKIKFIASLSGIDWAEVPEHNASKVTGLLSKVLDTLSWDDPRTLWWITNSIRGVFLDKDENLNETVPQEVREAFFRQTQSLDFQEAIKPNFARVLPYFQNDMLKSQDSKIKFIASLSGIDWAEVPEHNASKVTGLLSKVLDTLSWDDPRTLWWITNSIRGVFLDKDENLNETVPQEVREAFFRQTQSLDFQEAIKPNFARVLPYFQNDMLKSQDSKIKFVDSLRGMDWKEVSEGDTLNIARMLSKVLDAFPWENPAALASSIVNVLLDKTGALNALLPREIQEIFFNKTRSLGFSGAITSDIFLGLSKILPRFVQAKDTVKQLTISGGGGKIEEFPESLDSLVLSKVKVGTVALATLPSLNNLSFEGVTLDRLVIDPAHSQLKMTTKALSVSEIQGLENLEVFQKETLSSKDPFFNEITGLEVIKFTNPNHKIETLSFERDFSLFGEPRHPSRIEGLNNLPHLHVLDLSGGKVTSLEGFEHLTQLKKLKLSGSQFQSLVFTENHQTIEELDLHNFRLQNAQWIKPLTRLRSIAFLSGSEVDSLEFLPSHSSLEGLYVLHSSVNSIQGLGHLTSLERLSLVETRNLTTLNFEGELPNLREIEAYWSKDIEEIKGLDKLPKVETLFLEDTPSLKSLTFTENNKNLKTIRVNKSGVALLEGVDTLPNLETLKADGAINLTSVRFGSVNEKLKEIDLSQTGLISVEGVEELPALESLSFAGSKSLASPIHFSEKNDKIIYVSLPDTAVTQVTGLQHLTAAKTLDLRGLNLESLELFPNLKSTKVLLSGSSVETLTGAEIYARTELIRKIPTRDIRIAGRKMPPPPPQQGTGGKGLKMGYNDVLVGMRHIGKIVFTSPDKLLKELNILGREGSSFSIDRVEGLENFENLELITIKNVTLSSLNFTQDLEKLQRILIEGGQLDELTGLEHFPALKEVTVPSVAPKTIDLPEDVKFTHQQSQKAENKPDITTFKRPAAVKTHEEDD